MESGSFSSQELPSTQVCWMRHFKAMITGEIQPIGSKTFDESDKGVLVVMWLMSSKSIEKMNVSEIGFQQIPKVLILYSSEKSWSCSEVSRSSVGSSIVNSRWLEVHFLISKPNIVVPDTALLQDFVRLQYCQCHQGNHPHRNNYSMRVPLIRVESDGRFLLDILWSEMRRMQYHKSLASSLYVESFHFCCYARANDKNLYQDCPVRLVDTFLLYELIVQQPWNGNGLELWTDRFAQLVQSSSFHLVKHRWKS